MQHPRLYVGLIGFSAQQRANVASFLAANAAEISSANEAAYGAGPATQYPVWQICDFREANALLVLAPYAQSGQLQITPTSQDPSPLGVDLSQLSVPFAVQWTTAAPHMQSDANQLRTFNMDDPDSILKTLQYFEAMLRPLRTIFAISAHMIERRAEIDNKHVYHLVRNNMLDCILDIAEHQVMVRDGLRPVDLDDAAWLSRPLSANSLPQGFSVWSLEEVAWIYALHCPNIVLPNRYMQAPIYFRRLPHVRSGMIYRRHANLLEILGCAALTYDQLCEESDVDVENLERDLNGLYLCRAITTRSQKSAIEADGETSDSNLFSRSTRSGGDSSNTFKLETMPGHLM